MAQELLFTQSRSGILVDVKRKDGTISRGTFKGENTHNDKLIVYLDNGEKIMASKENVTVKGFVD
jgi:hypothetical protein